jgi:hypothetical protein
MKTQKTRAKVKKQISKRVSATKSKPTVVEDSFIKKSLKIWTGEKWEEIKTS